MSQYWAYTVADLKGILKERNLRVSGNRTILISRLAEYDSQHPFPFLKLPGEIRNEIYEYVLALDNTLKKGAIGKTFAANEKFPRHLRAGDWRNEASIAQPALFRTCSKVYAETRVLFYRHCDFEFHIWHERKSILNLIKTIVHLKKRHHTCLEKVTKWLDAIGANAQREIRTLDFIIQVDKKSASNRIIKSYTSFVSNLHARLSDEATVVYRTRADAPGITVLWALGKKLHDRDATATRLPKFEHPYWTIPGWDMVGIDRLHVWTWPSNPLVNTPSQYDKNPRASLTFEPRVGWFGRRA